MMLDAGQVRPVPDTDVPDLDVPMSRPAGRPTVRPMVPTDIAAVASLFLDRFRGRPGRRSPDLEQCLEAFLFRPEQPPGVPPGLVSMDAAGTIRGFVACAAQSMHWGERSLQAIGGGTLMVARQAEPLAVVRLLRRFFALPHDLAYTDTASPVSAAVLEQFGARMVPSLSLDWVLVRSRAGLALRLGLDRARLRWLDRALGLACRGRPAAAAKPGRAGRRISFGAVDHDAAGLVAAILSLGSCFPIRPAWDIDAAPLQFRLGEIRLRSRHGRFVARLGLDGAGDPVAVWLGHMGPGRVVRVAQALARPDAMAAMLDDMAAEAGTLGCVAIRGRLQPDMLAPLARRGALFVPRLATLVRSRDPGLIAACDRGEAHLTGLAGETWSRVFDEEFA